MDAPRVPIQTDEEIAEVYRELGLDDEQKRSELVAMATTPTPTPTLQSHEELLIVTTNTSISR